MSSLHSRITAVCRAHGLAMNTDAGQHFLIDESVLHAITEAAKLTGTEHVIEIGAGLGVLTRELVAKAGRVTAIEWDRRWIQPLKDFVDADHLPAGKLTIINANALKIPFPDDRYCVVANIPYNITAPLLQELFVHAKRAPDRAVLLIQREVAEKLRTDPPETYLGVLVALAGRTRIVRRVAQGAFLPPPAVESAVICIDTHHPPLGSRAAIAAALAMASIAFKGKRKMLRGTIGKIHGGMERLQAAGVAEERRPETLSAAEWMALGSVDAQH